MTDGYRVTLERLRQQREARSDRIDARLEDAAAKDAIARGLLAVGTRVFDAVSGQDGEVVPTSLAAPNGATTIAVRLLNGQVVARKLEQLIVRPTPPAVTR